MSNFDSDMGCSFHSSRDVVYPYNTEKKPVSSAKETKKIIMFVECRNGILVYNSKTKEEISELYEHEHIMFAQLGAPSTSKEKTNELDSKINEMCERACSFALKIDDIFELDELNKNLSDTYIYCIFEKKSKEIFVVEALKKEIIVRKNITAITFGESYYQDWFYQFLDKYDKTDDFKIDKDVDEFAIEFENEMKRLMKIWDLTGYFNPIKLPLNVVTFKF